VEHVHLPVVQLEGAPPGARRAPWDRARWLVPGFGLAAVAAIVVAFFQPWWRFTLYAPQYPKGLQLVISLTGMGGDVHEVDILNHYIGMHRLADAAPTERQLAGFGVAAVCVVIMTLLMMAGKRLNRIVAIPAISFPLIFLADSFYWLYSFGHDLDPRAPLRIAAFTPQMFGNGQIGQFETFATPALGFWIAIAGVAFAVAGTLVRSRVCANCEHADRCSAICPRAMILPPRSPKP
jgi:hypothetical protein